MIDMAGGEPTVVGVVGDVHDSGLREPIGAVAYSSDAHTPTGRGQLTLVVRTRGDARQAAGLMPALRDAVRRTIPSMPLRDIETVASRLHKRHASGTARRGAVGRVRRGRAAARVRGTLRRDGLRRRTPTCPNSACAWRSARAAAT